MTQVSVVPVHALKAHRGSRGVAAVILNLGTRWRWVINFMFVVPCITRFYQ